MARLVVKSGYQKDIMCYDKNGEHDNWEGQCDCLKRTRIFTLTSYKLLQLLWRNFKWLSLWFIVSKNRMRQFLIQSNGQNLLSGVGSAHNKGRTLYHMRKLVRLELSCLQSIRVFTTTIGLQKYHLICSWWSGKKRGTWHGDNTRAEMGIAGSIGPRCRSTLWASFSHWRSLGMFNWWVCRLFEMLYLWMWIYSRIESLVLLAVGSSILRKLSHICWLRLVITIGRGKIVAVWM